MIVGFRTAIPIYTVVAKSSNRRPLFAPRMVSEVPLTNLIATPMKMGCRYVKRIRNRRGSIGDSNTPFRHLANTYGSFHLVWVWAKLHLSIARSSRKKNKEKTRLTYIPQPRTPKFVFAVSLTKDVRQSRANEKRSAWRYTLPLTLDVTTRRRLDQEAPLIPLAWNQALGHDMRRTLWLVYPRPARFLPTNP